MKDLIANHPLWLVGFRPFFTVVFISGALLPFIWALVYSGWSPLEHTGLTPIQWHAHEMLFGFGWAVMAGFLLTASKNWVKIRGMHGWPLILAVALWIVERIAVAAIPADTPFWVRAIGLNIFLLYVIAYVVGSLVRFRKNDSFQDNYFFVIALPVFLLAKTMTLDQANFTLGTTLAIGLFRLAFAVMFERTMTQFMKNSFAVSLYRKPLLDLSIKGLILVSAFQAFLPITIAASLTGLAGVLLFVRFLLWSPLKGFSRFGIAIMYVGYLGLTLHFITETFRLLGVYTGIGTLSVHIFTFLTMGIVIPGMLIRICQGHTGRKLEFTKSDRFAISVMGLAGFFRIIATQLWPEQYSTWVALSGYGWTICFSVLGYRLIPFLWKERIDGRIH